MKPRIFISSTIYDFKDLRSAMKFYLENYGYEVLLSEFNDFTKKIAENSYQACLDTISYSDYFILLIGSRVGGYYDLHNQISITQMEYRKAYECIRANKLKILVFIREDIWTIKEDRKGLEEILVNEKKFGDELSENEIKEIVNHSSRIVNDADFIFKFINEVTRSTEMKLAIQGLGEYPKNNWVHTFQSFKDIVDVINVEFNIKKTIFEESLRFNLIQELNEIIRNLIIKENGKIQKQNLWGYFSRKNITKELDGFSSMKYKYFKWLTAFVVVGMSTVISMRTYFLEKALESGIFLEYDNLDGRFSQSIISDSLIKLLSRINRLRGIESSYKELSKQFLKKYDHLRGSHDDKVVQVENLDIVGYLAAYDLQEDILNLCVGLFKALNNDNLFLQGLKLNPVTPFEKENEQMENERPQDDELLEWINKYNRDSI